MRTWEIEAREMIRDLVARYNAFGDGGRWDELLSLFNDTSELTVQGVGTFAGHAAMRALFTQAAAGAKEGEAPNRIWHHTSTHVIDFESQDSARGSCYYAVLGEAGLDHWGRYRDRYRRTDSSWLFSERQVSVNGRTPGGWADRNLSRMASS